MIEKIRRYLHGWKVAYAIFMQMQRKKHGAGRAPLYIAWRAAMSARWIADGQGRGGRYPRYARKGLELTHGRRTSQNR